MSYMTSMTSYFPYKPPASTASTSSNSGTVAPMRSSTVDRSRNVVITGIEESRDSDVWRSSILAALSIAAGCEVRIEDAFRLGRFAEQRKRPILVKLTTAWDRRLVVSGVQAFQGYTVLTRVHQTRRTP